MAAAPEPELSSFFPNPPPFYKHFTAENQERLKQTTDDATQLSPEQLLSLPTELRYLVPPEPPADDDEYRVFGEVAKVHGIDDFSNMIDFIRRTLDGGETQQAPLLADWQYQQLYPSPPADADASTASQTDWSLDRQHYLFRFLRSTLLSFVELLGIVSSNPTSPQKDQKLRDILTLVANMHALLNEYRPHQARETLINMMKEQLERKREEVVSIRRMKQKVQETLDDFAKGVPERPASLTPDDAVVTTAEEIRKTSQRYMWQAMDEILGQ